MFQKYLEKESGECIFAKQTTTKNTNNMTKEFSINELVVGDHYSDCERPNNPMETILEFIGMDRFGDPTFNYVSGFLYDQATKKVAFPNKNTTKFYKHYN